MNLPFERLLIRFMVALAFLFFVVTALYQSFSRASIYLVFVFIFIVAEFLLPSKPRPDEKQWQRIASRIVLGLLSVSALVLFVPLAILWKLGPFGHLP